MIPNLTSLTNTLILLFMNKKAIIFGIIVAVWGFLFFVVKDFTKKEDIDIVSPIKKQIAKDVNWPGALEETFLSEREKLKANSVFENDNLNVLLLGIDTSEGRRTRGQGGFNTDTMILLTINPNTNRVLLTSVPRDLWINGNKLNALYSVYGEATLVDAFEKVTGQKVDGVIRADFDHFEWIVDSFGGIPVDVQTTFTDISFPNRTDSGAVTVTFTAGEELMSGERALTFARSRKGNNGEGSDLMRAKRQHRILESMIEAIAQPTSEFWPMDIKTFFEAVTATGKMYTTLTLDDAKYLWDFYKDKDLYTVESFVVDGEYIYHPGMYPESEYHAWVFIAKEPGFTNLHSDILEKLETNTYEEEATYIRGQELIPLPEEPVENIVEDTADQNL